MVLVGCGIIGFTIGLAREAVLAAISNGNATFLIFFLIGLGIFVAVSIFLPYEDMSEYEELDED